MFKECLIDTDFNLLVLNVTSVSEISYSPASGLVPGCCAGAATAGGGDGQRVVPQAFTVCFF